MKQAMLIVNPSSGKELGEQYSDHALKTMKEMGYETVLRLTKGEGDAMEFAREACEKRYDFLAAMGGDGTINEAINGMAEQEYRPLFGLIPLGTVNDFARALNIPMKPEEAIDIFKQNHVQKTDVGKINDRYFINIVAVGALAEASFSTPVEQKSKLGPLAYIIEGMKKMKEKQPFELKVQSEHDWEGEALLMLVALTNSVGGMETIAPEAKVNDGQLHVFIIKDMALPKFLLLLPKILLGELAESEHVHYMKVTKLQANSTYEMIANVDGDEGDQLPITIENLKQHLNILVPVQK
ncbi:diacylglycerol kinase family protein [Rossellomorea vietnamensis]|uniref:YegS/Rv2252/BmrU family lipid kinase n=1 Tax=Rossellomorea vietnamensis TaxID=218284 RepID=A0ACD4C989_9BACI|nr:YegS/Rv2252/BmrU family lipid kinase [Rossellomorea vietnamensis]UXH45133.1 YegS/Rv2252/BmrU family lipid kinase [Rossellomorea vietnamensis]WQI96489.1 YegS/Rv2252/BmrU family lipid kinase [Rossellomorea vietnamensis]